MVNESPDAAAADVINSEEGVEGLKCREGRHSGYSS